MAPKARTTYIAEKNKESVKKLDGIGEPRIVCNDTTVDVAYELY